MSFEDKVLFTDIVRFEVNKYMSDSDADTFASATNQTVSRRKLPKNTDMIQKLLFQH